MVLGTCRLPVRRAAGSRCTGTGGRYDAVSRGLTREKGRLRCIFRLAPEGSSGAGEIDKKRCPPSQVPLQRSLHQSVELCSRPNKHRLCCLNQDKEPISRERRSPCCVPAPLAQRPAILTQQHRMVTERVGGSGPSSLFEQCIEAAAAGSAWRVQKRSLERLPEHAANLLLARLIDRQALGTAPNLELFRSCVTKADLKAMPGASGQHLVYLSEFTGLQELSLAGCLRLRDTQLVPLAQLHHSLTSLSLKGCSQASSCGMQAVSQLSRLRDLDLSETSISPPATAQLSGLTALTSLRLDHVQLSDACLAPLSTLSALCQLSLQCAQGVTDTGLMALEPVLLGLTHLDVAWTQVTLVPLPPKLKVLHMEHCRLSAVWRLQEAPLQLQELHLSCCSSAPQAQALGGSDCSDTVCDAILAAAASLKLLDLQGIQSFSFTERSGALRFQAGGSAPELGAGRRPEGPRFPSLPAAGDLAGTATGSRGPGAQVLHLPHLRALDLRGCGVIAQDLLLLRAAAPLLRCLLLGGCSKLTAVQGAAAAAGSRLACRGATEGRVWLKLQKLDLSSCNLSDSDLPWLLDQPLPTLQHLDLSHNPLTGQPPATRLGRPDIDAAELRPDLAPLQQPQPRAGHHMEAVWAAPVDSSDPEPGTDADAGGRLTGGRSVWERLVRLRSLLLVGTQLSAAGAQALSPLAPSLTHLELGHPSLSSDVLPYLTALSELRHLSLANSPALTPASLMKLQRGLPLLTRLELHGSWSMGRKDVLALLEEAEAAGDRLAVVVAADGEKVLSAQAAALAAEAAVAEAQERAKEGGGEARGLRSWNQGGSRRSSGPSLPEDCDERFRYSHEALLQLRVCGAEPGEGQDYALAAAAAAAGAEAVLRAAVAAAASELLT